MEDHIDNIERLIDLAVEEDLGDGDVTSRALFGPRDAVTAEYRFREDAVFCGGPALAWLFQRHGPGVQLALDREEGAPASAGRVAATVRGPAREVFALERVSLNLLGRLTGVATLTRRFVEAIAGTGTAVFDTRKTCPGWRMLDKYAVRTGGGSNHRMGLYDQVLIKDNHIAAAGGDLADIVRRARAEVPDGILVEIEVDTLGQLEAVLDADPDIVLLDNMTTDELARAVAMARSADQSPVLEASGGVTLDNVREIALAGVDRVSVGALTHSAGAIDISLEIAQ